MKQEERDDLLIRVSERTLNIWHTIEKIEQHAAAQNGSITDLIRECSSNTSWRKTSKWIIGVWSGINVTLAGGIIFAMVRLL